MDKEVVHIYDGILLSHKRNETGSFGKTWMNLKDVIQSEVSQKEKNEHHVSMHVYRIYKNGLDDLICKTEIETQIQRTNVWKPRQKGEGEKIGRLGLTHIHYGTMCKIDKQ